MAEDGSRGATSRDKAAFAASLEFGIIKMTGSTAVLSASGRAGKCYRVIVNVMEL